MPIGNHIPQDEKDKIERFLEANPEIQLNQVAKRFGVSKTVVARISQALSHKRGTRKPQSYVW